MRQHTIRAGEALSVLSVADLADFTHRAASEPGTRGAVTRHGPTRPWRPTAAESSLGVDDGPGGGLGVLADGGALGALVRGRDWSRTSVGTPDRWPRSLRNALRLLQAAPYPMCVWWGPELLHFYNDAYAQLFGANGASPPLGHSAREVIDGVTWRGEPTVVEDRLVCLFRNGYAEETYVSARLDPIRGDDGAIGGVVAALAETTDRVITHRRTAVLRGLAAASADARSVEEACRRALAELARHPTDIPFALLYLRNAGATHAHLVAAAGLAAGEAASPERIELDTSGPSGWPVAAAIGSGDAVIVDDLPTRFGTLPAGDWPLVPRSALVLPLTPAGCDRPEAVLIAGVSARRALDAEYRGFVELVAQQVTAAIASGRAHEDERRRAEAAATAAKRARARRRAQERALEARFAGVLAERTRMAREIHDTLLQGFTGITLQLQAIVHEVTRAPERARDDVERILALADKTLADARQAVWDMRAPALLAKSLAEALQDVVRRAADGAPPLVRFRLAGTPRPLEPAAEMALFRIAQEAVANALKHAAARTVDVELAYERRAARLVVRDDGRGFEPGATPAGRGGHWGLVGMRERADHVGARLAITSAPGRGTEVTAVVRAR